MKNPPRDCTIIIVFFIIGIIATLGVAQNSTVTVKSVAPTTEYLTGSP